jgi:phosphoribosylanthranilate isomerase
MKTWIKFCGTTSLEDALKSADAGADALGFIFAPSKRRITPERAQDIIEQLPPGVERIGVFLNTSPQEIGEVVAQVDLTGIQLHGNEVATNVRQALPRTRSSSLRIIKTIMMGNGIAGAVSVALAAGEAIYAWLLDSGAGGGKTFDWQAARTEVGSSQDRFIIAGGLTPENVAEAIRMFAPWGVDVVTGIEREPGHKDPEKLKAFVSAVRRAEQL